MACKPMVMDPIDIAWGPDGKAWVVEMADYPMGLDDAGKPWDLRIGESRLIGAATSGE